MGGTGEELGFVCGRVKPVYGYADAREGAIRQAKAIYGNGSAQCSSIAAAFDGIAVPAGTQTCSN